MNIRDLEYLVALERYRHFNHAASACNVSQPTLSAQIRKLENELNITLLERTSRKIIFTQVGLDLAEQARQILQQIQIFREIAKKQSKFCSIFNVGLIPTIAPYLLPIILPLLKHDFPNIQFHFYEEKTEILLKKLNKGQLDFVIVSMLSEVENFHYLPLYEEKMYLTLPKNHPLNKKKLVLPSDLKGEKVLMLEDGHCLRNQTLGYCFLAGLVEDTRFQATSLETLKSLISVGIGMTFLPELSISSQNSDPNIVYLNQKEFILSREIVLVHRSGTPLKQNYQEIAFYIKQKMHAFFLKKEKEQIKIYE